MFLVVVASAVFESSAIKLAGCGDGIIDHGEECDDGNTVSGDGCSFPSCQLPVCGNSLLEFGEQCEDGNNATGDGCSFPSCQCEESPCRFHGNGK